MAANNISSSLIDFLEKASSPVVEGSSSSTHVKLKDILFNYAMHNEDPSKNPSADPGLGKGKEVYAGKVHPGHGSGVSITQHSTSIKEAAAGSLQCSPGQNLPLPQRGYLGEKGEEGQDLSPAKVRHEGTSTIRTSQDGKEGSTKVETFKLVSDWRRLFAEPKVNSFNLSFKPPTLENGRIVVEPPNEVVYAGSKRWEKAIVGQFLDRSPPFFAMQRSLQKLWGKGGPFQIFTLENGVYIFKFDDDKLRESVIGNGIWTVAGRPMVVYKWRPDLEPMKFQLTTLPIWVKLHNVPPEYWTEEGVSWLASAIGNPLYVDAATEEGNQMGFMKVCVEVQVEDKLPSSFPIRRNGKEILIRVEYPWKPARCSKCKVFGHSTGACRVPHIRAQKEEEAKLPPQVQAATSSVTVQEMEEKEEGEVVELAKDPPEVLIPFPPPAVTIPPQPSSPLMTSIGRKAPSNPVEVKNGFTILETVSGDCLQGKPEPDPGKDGKLSPSSSHSSPGVSTFKGLRDVDEVDKLRGKEKKAQTNLSKEEILNTSNTRKQKGYLQGVSKPGRGVNLRFK